MTSSFGLKFSREPSDYLAALSFGRWNREFASPCRALGGTLEVTDWKALPAPGSGEALSAAALENPGAIVYPADSGAAEEPLRWAPPPVSTLREFEAAGRNDDREVIILESAPANPPARFVPTASGPNRLLLARGFKVLRVRESFGVREEILELIPKSSRRLLDVGCGAGETAGEARRRIPGLWAVGIDSNPTLAEAAKKNLASFHFGDALESLARIAAGGERFDTIVLADFLEHVADPFVLLRAALEVASPGATVVVSVPNISCIPVIEDLLLGRFDPIGAGVEDAGHLRLFTRRLLVELLAAAGLRDIQVRGVPVPSDGSRFLAGLRASGIPFVEEELRAIQWLATATVGR